MEIQPFEDVSPIRSNQPIGVSLGCELLRLDLLTSQVEILSDVLWLKRNPICWTGGKTVSFFLKDVPEKNVEDQWVGKLWGLCMLICLRIYFLCSNIRIPFTLHVAAKHLLQVAIVHWPIFWPHRSLVKKLVSGCNDHLSGIKFLIFLADQTMHKWQFWRHFPSKNRALS